MRRALSSAQVEGLVGEVMTMETMLASLAMLTLADDVGQGELLSPEQRKSLTREVLMWAAEAIERIDKARQLAARMGQN